jgi:predicted nucleic acid-binding protein
MILVDSSAFIEYYRPSGSPRVRAAVADAIAADLVAVNGVVWVEIIAFAATESDYRKLISDFEIFRWLELGSHSFNLASELGFMLRRKGITIPATDLIIAASAVQHEATLYHVDSHYDMLAKHSALRVKNLQGLP